MPLTTSGNQPQLPPSKNLNNLDAYGYDLPEELIAQHPLTERDKAKLMVINRQAQTITHDIFSNIDRYLPHGTTFVVNNSKVIPARLLGVKPTGGEVEVFLLKQLDDYHFEALLRPLKRVREHEPIDFGFGISASLENREQRIVKFNQPNILPVLEKVGHIPLPPYIKRSDNIEDKEYYQTVYAKNLGSVASPTAGLHFTTTLINRLKEQGHHFYASTLHIGYGTFKPVETQDIRQHPMHTESYELLNEVYDTLLTSKAQKAPIAAVGTTSCRVLESVAASGKLTGDTNIFIYPGYEFKMVDILITNFHLPFSTLLMLVSAFGGYDLIRRAYQEAIAERYRFYSYGDAMIIY